MKNYILPLGCHFHPPLDSSKRCDSPSCSVSSDLPWKLFEGCWHSFYLSCLNGLNICVICQDGLKKNMTLSKIANEAFAGGPQTARPDEDQECLKDGEVEEQINNNDDDDEDILEVGEVNVDQIRQRLTRQFFNIQVNQLSATTTEVDDESNQRDQPAGRRPCHCTVCRQRHQGHQYQTTETGERITHCLYCPNQICCRGVEGLLILVSGVNNTVIN